MAITSGVEFSPTPNTPKKELTLAEKLDRDDNVKDLKNKVKDLLPNTEQNEVEDEINKIADHDFDTFFLENQAKITQFLEKGTYASDGKAWMKKEFKAYIANHELAKYIDKLQDADIKKVIDETTFELNELSEDITSSLLKGLKKEVTTGDQINPKETLVENTSYGYKPEKFDFDELGPKGKMAFEYDDIDEPVNGKDILNIYKKGGLHKEMEKLLGDLGDLSPRDFKINLSPVNGLAGLVLYLEQHSDEWEKVTSGRDIKRCGFDYSREGGSDHERGKLADIIKYAQQNPEFKTKLIAFAHEVKSFGPEYEKRLKQDINFHNKNTSAESILKDLCDYNGDGILSVQYHDFANRKQHRKQWKKNYQESKGTLPSNWRDLWKKDWFATKEKQKMGKGENQGDVGTIFGPQLFDALQTAINVAQTRVENNDKQFLANHPGVTTGESAVVYNILQNIAVGNQDPLLATLLKEIKETECDRASLASLCQAHPSFQPLFAQTIERINGSSHELAPDLVDRLIGIERIPPKYPSLAEKLDGDSFCRDIAAMGKKMPSGEKVRVGSPEFVQMKAGLMTFLDNVNIDATVNDQGKLLALGLDKSLDINQRRHEVENKFLKDLLSALSSITFDPATLTVGFGFGQSGTSEDLRTKRGRNSGVSAVLGTPILSVKVGGELAHQFNYTSIITDSLDKKGSSQYLGAGVGVNEIFIGVAPVATVAEAALQYQKDSKAAIEQVYNQYTDVINEVFQGSLTKESLTSGDALSSTLLAHFDRMYKVLSKKKPDMAKFIDNNRQYFETNIKQLGTYFGQHGILDAINKADKPLDAAQAMMGIFTQGLTAEWREMMYNRLAGKTELSKVSLGLGAMFVANTYPVVYPKIGIAIRHRRNNYISLENQKALDANIINAGGIDKNKDVFLPEPPSVEAYAQYIKSVFSLTEKDARTPLLEAKEEPQGYISLTSTKGNISDIIDIRSKVQQSVLDNCAFSADGKTLIIGNVGNITAYTQSDGLGKRCFLVLGGESTQKTCRLPSTHNSGKTLDAPMTFTTKSTKTTETKTTKKEKTENETETNTTTGEQTLEKTLSFTSLLSETDGTQKIENTLKDMVKSLMELEKGSPSNYKKLIKETSEGFIGIQNLTQAVKALTRILNNAKFPSLVTTLQESSPNIQAYIVDRCKQIFAKEPKYSSLNIGEIVKSHKSKSEMLKRIVGPSGKTISGALVEELLTQRKQYESNTDKYVAPTVDPTLIGYSAFYRWDTQKQSYISKNFSLTSLGGTGYQGELYTIKEHADQAKEWVLNNLKNNEQEMNTLKDRINNLCKQQNISLDLSSPDWIEKIIDGSLPIDNSNNKIRLNVDWVFYLLGECCNESLGMKIKSLDILTSGEQGSQENEQGQESETGGEESQESLSYQSNVKIGGRNLSSGMKVGSYGEDLNIGIGLISTEKKGGDKTTPGLETQDGDRTGAGIETGDVGSDHTGPGIGG